MLESSHVLARLEWIKFPVMLGSCYLIFYVFYYHIPDDTLRKIYQELFVNFSVTLINTLSSEEYVTGDMNKLVSTRAILSIARGCEGAGALFLLLSAILVFPSGLKQKVLGLLCGSLLVYLLNVIRIVVLYFIIAYNKSWFLPIHALYAPSLLILLCSLFFLSWAFYRAESA